MNKSRSNAKKSRPPNRPAKKAPAPKEALSQKSSPEWSNALTDGALTIDNLLWLQRSVGNRSARRLLENRARNDSSTEAGTRSIQAGLLMTSPNPVTITYSTSLDPTVQRLMSVAKLDKKIKAKEKKKTKKEDVGEPAGKAKEAPSFEKIRTALDQYHQYYKEFKKLNPAYADHAERLKKLQNVLAEIEIYISKAVPGDPLLETAQALLKDAQDTYVKASPNAKRAKTARRELRAIKKKDKNSPKRITDELINMMVMSIAAPMSETDEKGASGILGVGAAADAAETLVMMQQKEYEKMLLLLAESGDDPGIVVKKATLLRALAARKKDFIVAGPQGPEQMFVIEVFGAIIKDMGAEELVESTHTAERGSGEGLQQRFTMSCGPTSIEIVRGEVDPVHAYILSSEGKKSLDPIGTTAKKQKELLENIHGADKALPRVVSDDWDTLVAATNTFFTGTATVAQQVQLQHAFAYIASQAHDAAKKNAGLALLKTLGTGVDVDKRIPEFRKYYSILGNAPGINNAEFASMAKSELGGTSDRGFKETPIAYKEKLIKGKKQLRGEINKHFWKLDKALFRGNKVPFGVMWAGGGGHFMVFVDKRKMKKGKKTTTHYLVADPWTGKSGWMDRTELSQGLFDKIGQGQGAIDSIYL